MLKHGILGLLNYGEKTGYEIMRLFKEHLNYFWAAQTSQIYRELQKLEEGGYVVSRRVEQTGKPDKNVFSITEAGKEELRRWLADRTGSLFTNKPALMRAFFMGELPPEAGIGYFRVIEDACRLYLDQIGNTGPVEPAPDEDREAWEKRSAYWKMTLDYGRRNLEMTIAWARDCQGILRLQTTEEKERNGDEVCADGLHGAGRDPGDGAAGGDERPGGGR